MKTNLFRNLTTAIGLLSLTFIISLNARAQGSSTFSLPGYTMEYLHDGTNWNHTKNVTSTYNASGFLTELITTHPQTGQNLSRSIFTYDAIGNQRSVIFYRWQNMTWVMAGGSRDSLTYNAGNKIIRKVSTNYQNSSWENYRLEENTYDANNNQTESTISTWDNAAWLPQSRYTYTYDANGIITEKVTYFYLSSPYSITKTESYSAWHVPNSIPAAYTSLTTGSLYPDRHTVTLGPNGSYSDVSEYYYIYSNTWGYSNRQTYTKDSHGNETGHLNENFDQASNAWQRQAESKNLFTYNSQGDMTEMIRQATDNTSMPNRPLLNIYKLVHSNFQYFNRALGTPEAQKFQFTLNVYPNPATDKIQIDLSEKNSQALTIVVSDITGKTWLNKTFKAAEGKQLNIEALPKGVYLLHVQTETGSAVKRIVKQ